MIKRIETTEELSKIYPVLPSEYIQWLTEGITNPKLHIWVESDTDIIGYVVALDSVVSPLSDYFSILFDYGDSKKSLQALKEAAGVRGAKSLIMAAPEITDKLTDAGFEFVSVNVMMRV